MYLGWRPLLQDIQDPPEERIKECVEDNVSGGRRPKNETLTFRRL